MKHSVVKKFSAALMAAVFVLGLAGFVVAAEKIVGVVEEVSDKGNGVMEYVIVEEKGGAKKNVTCNTKGDCAVKPGAEAKGAKVTVEKKDKGTTIRKAVAGC